MDPPVQRSVASDTFSAWRDVNVVYKIIAAVLLGGLLQNVLFRRPQKDARLPVWAPLEIAITGLIVTGGSLGLQIYNWVRKYGGPLFGLTSSHQILINFSGVDRLMSTSHSLITGPVQYTLMTRVFGAQDTPDDKKKFEDNTHDLTAAVERLFLREAAATATIEKGNIPDKVASLVTFSTDPGIMKRWERSANIRVLIPELPGQRGVAEANLQSLTRDLGACVAIPLLFGQDLLDRSPRLLDDFWNFDNNMFPLLMIGVPQWAPFKMMREARAARARMIDEVAAWARRVDQYQRGQPVDFGADMSDVSTTAIDRYKIYARDNYTWQQRGVGDFAIMWGQNANTQPMLFWLLVFAYSTPGLVDELREEMAPYVSVSNTEKPTIDNLDLPGLYRNCQLLKSCLFESYRMANEGTSLRYVAQPITVKDGAYQHELKAGTWLSAPHGASQRDASVYADPDTFVPDRFLEADAASGKRAARYGKLKPWGSGTNICKGRTFAEKELLALSATIISLWDIGPADGTWKVPAMTPGTGVKKPVEDVRVVITRRVV